jgi:hypothetical protein
MPSNPDVAWIRARQAEFFASLTPRQRVNHWLRRRCLAIEEWLLDRPDWLSDHDWLYDWADPFCRLLGHIPDGPEHCLYCGRIRAHVQA